MNPLPGVSVVITVRNEARTIGRLMQSLLVQEGPLEIVVVDALSSDGTWEALLDYASSGNVRLFRERCSRGGGRNIGVQRARYEYILFTDGDAWAHPDWVRNMRRCFLSGASVVAGRTEKIARAPFGRLNRLELFYHGSEVTLPSVNLGYRKDLFLALGGFDQGFVTAEDIDLNIRSVMAGNSIVYCGDAIIYHEERDDISGFIRQAFWNGYGRWQLRRKHPDAWAHTSPLRIGLDLANPWYLLRSFSGAMGYIYSSVTGGKISMEG